MLFHFLGLISKTALYFEAARGFLCVAEHFKPNSTAPVWPDRLGNRRHGGI